MAPTTIAMGASRIRCQGWSPLLIIAFLLSGHGEGQREASDSDDEADESEKSEPVAQIELDDHGY